MNFRKFFPNLLKRLRAYSANEEPFIAPDGSLNPPILANALQDSVHRDVGRGRPANKAIIGFPLTPEERAVTEHWIARVEAFGSDDGLALEVVALLKRLLNGKQIRCSECRFWDGKGCNCPYDSPYRPDGFCDDFEVMNG